MSGNGVPRTRLGLTATLIVSILLVVSLSAFSLSPGRRSTAPGGRPAATSARGVTPTTVKVGIALVDYDCIKQFVDSIRVNQQQVYQAFIDDINAKGGINGRKIKPVYDTLLPARQRGAARRVHQAHRRRQGVRGHRHVRRLLG